MEHNCPLCFNQGELFLNYRNRNYYRCSGCLSVFIDSSTFLNPDEEKGRYLEHNNDVFNEGYRKFVDPVVKAVTSKFNTNHRGLDFGSGTGPVVSQILNENGYEIVQFDPYFKNDTDLLERKYDYIVCCEVIEHFNNPHKEFELLRSMLNTGGELICMTNIYNETIDFLNWHYKDDPTHVFFYHRQAFEYIVKKYGFNDLRIENRLVRLMAK
jgi:SAM-dependent methyltransferase